MTTPSPTVHAPLLSQFHRQRPILQRIGALDPGGLRLRSSARGVFACVTAGVVMVLLMRLAGNNLPNIVLLSILLCFVSQLVILAPQPHERRRGLVWGIVAATAAVGLISVVSQWYWITFLLMTPWIFFSFYLRRYGLLAASLGMIFLFSYYFDGLFGVTPADLFWGWIAAAVAMLATLAWQDILMPYRPREAMWKAVFAFGNYVGDGVQSVAASIGVTLREDAEREVVVVSPETALADVRRSGLVIMQQSAALTGAGGWDVTRSGALRNTLYAIENGLERMVWAAAEMQSTDASLSPALQHALARTLAALEEAARRIGDEVPLARLSAEGETLLATTRENDDLRPTDRVALTHIALGGRQIAAELRKLADVSGRADAAGTASAMNAQSRPEKSETGRSGAVQARSPQQIAPSVTIWNRFHVHPTTLLAVQAVLAYLLGLTIAFLLQWEHANWIFWSSYVVLAGSTGESLFKLRNRLFGTLLGVIVGTLLVYLLPTSIWITLTIMFACCFLSLYTRVISYAWMVFWVTILVAALYGAGGSPSLEVLIARPLGVVLGGFAAAVVVLWVLPFRAGDRFKAALAGYLKSTDALLAGLSPAAIAPKEPTAHTDATTNSPVAVLAAQHTAAYEALAQTFPGVAHEYNPLTEARSPFLTQETIVAAINKIVEHLADDLAEETLAEAGEELTSAMRDAIAHSLQMVHRNLQRTIGAIASGPPRDFEAIQSPVGGHRASVHGTVERSAISLGEEMLGDISVLNQRLRDLAMAQEIG